MTTCQQAALRYLELGFQVLPVDGKRGFIKGGWKAAASTPEEVRAYWAAYPNANVALVLPPDRCVLDSDPRNGGDNSLAAWEKTNGPLPQTVSSQTGGGGAHWYFHCDPTRKLKHQLAPGLDILGHHAQAVEWPSHTQGPYRWHESQAPGQIAYAEAPETFYEPIQGAPPASKPNGALAGQDSIYRYCRAALTNARQRLAQTPAGGRNKALNDAALGLGHLAHHAAFTETEAQATLEAACLANGLIPEDGQAAFESTFASGWTKGLDEPQQIEQRPGNGHQPQPVETGPGITGEALAEREFPPLEWLIPGVLPIGATLVAGKAKIGKSWLVLDMGLAVATGTHCFGKIQAKQAGVLYLALEDGPRRLHSRQQKLMGTLAPPSDIEYFTQWPSIDEGLVEALAHYLDAHPKCRLVIIDTLGKVRGRPDGRSGVFQQDYSDISTFQKFAALRNIALLIVHHARKQSADDVMDMISGTTAMQAAPDTIIVLTRKRGQTAGILSISGKDIEEEGEYALDFDKLTGRWNWLGEAGQVKRDSEQQKIYDFLAAQIDPIGPSAIAAELEISLNTVSSALRRLKKLGSVTNKHKGLWSILARNDPE